MNKSIWFAGCVLLLIPAAASAQSYSIDIVRVSGTCATGTTIKFAMSLKGDEIVGQSQVGTKFTAKVGADGSFKTTYRDFRNRETHVEGNVKPGQRILKLTSADPCVFEGKE